MPVEKVKDYIKNSMKSFIEMRETLRKIDDSVSR